jgi:uncharacterized protein (DUF1684 family)
VADELSLLDWKRRVFDLYAQVRDAADPQDAWLHWRAARDELFRNHPESPLLPGARDNFAGLAYWPYDPTLRVGAEVVEREPEMLEIGTSGGGTIRFGRFAAARFDLADTHQELQLYWLEGYGGGVFLPFADATAGRESYGGGRYLLDTVKGSDLGSTDRTILLDFNFAYNPSCAYDPHWVCPLAPSPNRMPLRIEAGERSPGT